MFSTIQPKELQDKAVLAVAISNSSHIFFVDRGYGRYNVYAVIHAYNVNTCCSLLGCKKCFSMTSAFVSRLFFLDGFLLCLWKKKKKSIAKIHHNAIFSS